MDEDPGGQSVYSGFHVRQGGKNGNVQVSVMKHYGCPSLIYLLDQRQGSPAPGRNRGSRTGDQRP